MAPTSRLDGGRKARLFDMERPVVHTRNNYFLKGEHCSFFFLIFQSRIDLTLISCADIQNAKSNI